MTYLQSSRTIFQSTHPARGATDEDDDEDDDEEISIHAPREGCDLCLRMSRISSLNFNPRTPRGVRHDIHGFNFFIRQFQSTHPARGATMTTAKDITILKISIHAPREGCDASN